MKEFAPGPHYDPSAQVNVLCAGKQVDDAMCSYLFDVAKSRQQTSDSVIFIGAGVLGRSSWLDCQIVENCEKIEFRTDYPWGEVVQRIVRKASQWKTQVIVEVPPEAQVQQTKQYKNDIGSGVTKVSKLCFSIFFCAIRSWPQPVSMRNLIFLRRITGHTSEDLLSS